jgi:cell division protein ZapE
VLPVYKAYQALLTQRSYTADAAQLAAVARLETVHQGLHALSVAQGKPFIAVKRWFSKPEIPRGVWLWGGVGRGKSFIMDCFYDTVNIRRKTRIHFHEFMRSIHQELKLLVGTSDPLDAVAKQVADKYQLLCFDEFHVSDVADAMILHRLLDRLFVHGVVFVMTSNYAPDRLYPEGLHRDRILPAIALLKAHLDVVNVDAGIDYRRQTLASVPAYWFPSDVVAMAALNKTFTALAECADETPELHIENRVIQAKRKAGSVLWCDFAQLCGSARSQNDYLDIATQFHTVILTDIPQLKASQASEARRLTWLIDVFYDHKVKLLMAAAVPSEAIYTQGQFANEFHRTVSRIVEMQSAEYLAAERRLSVAL